MVPYLELWGKEPNVTRVTWAKVSKVNIMQVYSLKVQKGRCRMGASDHSSFTSKLFRYQKMPFSISI